MSGDSWAQKSRSVWGPRALATMYLEKPGPDGCERPGRPVAWQYGARPRPGARGHRACTHVATRAMYPPSWLVAMSEADVACTRDILPRVPCPPTVAQRRVRPECGKLFVIKEFILDASRHFKHFAGFHWCFKCAGSFSLVTGRNYPAARILQAACKNRPANATSRKALI